MRGPKIGPSLDERVRAALRREGRTTSAGIAQALGATRRAVLDALRRGVRNGWALEVDEAKDGHAGIFAFRKDQG